MEAGVDEPWSRVSPRVLLLGVLLLSALVYLPTLTFDFVYDDHWTILANGFLRMPGDLPLLLGPQAHAANVPDAFRPTLVVFDMASYQLLGVDPWPHHAASVLLHVGVVALLAAWLRGAGLELEDVSGLAYEPWRNSARIVSRTDVNYLACARKPG